MIKVPDKLFCPICGNEMDADIHAPQDGAIWAGEVPPYTHEELRKMDLWICVGDKEDHCVISSN
jgi:hypothetical protein